MLRFLSRTFIIFVLVIAATFALMWFTAVPRQVLAPVETAARSVVDPVNAGLMALTRYARGLTDMFVSVGELQGEKAELVKELGELRQENNRLKEYQLENIRLRELLGFKESSINQFNLMAASVVGRNPSNWHSTLTVNRGSRDGVKPDMVVIVPEGLVGRVTRVTPHTAEVILILDPDAAVGGVSQTVDQTPGVVVGTDDGLGYLKMIHVPYDAVISKGDTIVTSGLGRLYPRGLRIGSVIRVENESGGFLKHAILKPFASFDHLQEVFLVTGVHEENLPKLPEPPKDNAAAGANASGTIDSGAGRHGPTGLGGNDQGGTNAGTADLGRTATTAQPDVTPPPGIGE